MTTKIAFTTSAAVTLNALGEYIGSANPDTIDGTSGADTLFGFGGGDTIIGGAGVDFINGGADDDILLGDGAYFINNLSALSAEQDDPAPSNGDRDTVYGGRGNDIMAGGANFDVMNGNIGDDEVSGDLGNDLLNGGQGNDTIRGGEGADTIYGDRGNDILSGKADERDGTGDVFVFRSDSGADWMTDLFNGALPGSARDQIIIERNINGTTIDDFQDVLSRASAFTGVSAGAEPATDSSTGTARTTWTKIDLGAGNELYLPIAVSFFTTANYSAIFTFE